MTNFRLATNPAPTADDVKIIARNSRPLPMNTDEKNLSSSLPKPSRTTPMNQRNAIPENGINVDASLILSAAPSTHCDPGAPPSGKR